MRMRQADKQERWVRRGAVVLALALAAAGCSPESAGAGKTPLVWPEPPEQPRIEYLGAVSTETDMEKRGSLLRWVRCAAVRPETAGGPGFALRGGGRFDGDHVRRRFRRRRRARVRPENAELPAVLLVGERREAAKARRLGPGRRLCLRRSTAALRQVCVFKRNGDFSVRLRTGSAGAARRHRVPALRKARSMWRTRAVT